MNDRTQMYVWRVWHGTTIEGENEGWSGGETNLHLSIQNVVY